MASRDLASQLYAKAQGHPVSEWRRGTARRYIRELVLLRPVGTSCDIHGCSVDVGPDSIGVSCHEPLATGERVLVRLSLKSDEWWMFEVRHCSPSISGFKIGLQVVR